MKNKTDMKRKNFYLSKNELKLLEKESKKIGITISEVIRRIIDSYFENAK